MESQIFNLAIYLNDTKMADMLSIIRLKQSQINNWESKNIITDEIPPSFDCKENFIAKVLKLANKLEIRFKNNIMEKMLQWKGGNFSIQSRIVNNKIYKKSISSLKKKQLILGFRKVPKLVPKWYRTSTDYSKFNIWVMTHLYEFIVNLSIKLVPNWYRTGTVRSPN